jgi:hypothetical protein
MIRIAIIAPLLLATGMGANAEICIIPTDDVVQARTAKCLLSIDGMLLVDDRCNFRVSPDGHRTTLDAGKDYAEVNVTPRGAGYRLLESRHRPPRPADLARAGHQVR